MYRILAESIADEDESWYSSQLPKLHHCIIVAYPIYSILYIIVSPKNCL